MHRRLVIPDEDAAVALRMLASACDETDGTGPALSALRAFLRRLQVRVAIHDVADMIGAALDRLARFECATSSADQKSLLRALLDLAGLIARALECSPRCWPRMAAAANASG